MTETRKYPLSTYVAPDRPAQPLTPVDLPPAVDLVRHDAGGIQVRQADDELVRARAHLVVSLGYIAGAAATIAGLLLLAFLAGLMGENIWRYVATWIAGTGLAALIIMAINRRQLHIYSAPGIEHHRIDAQERIAHHALRLHAQLLRERWTYERRQTPDD